MPTVAELKVLVEAETGPLEAGLRRADRAVQELARSAEASGRQMSLGWQAAATAAGMLTAQLATKLIGAVTGAATSVLRLGIDTNAMMEQAKAGFTTLIGSAQEAETFLQQLADFARKTPFTMESALAGARNLMAMGFSARDTIPWLQTLGNVTAALGAGSDVYFQLAYAIGQIQAKGRLAGQELMQLANAGVNVNEIFEILSQQTGKSVEELKKLQEQGRISAQEFLEAFKVWADSRFGDAMAQQAQTFRGALSNLSDTLKLLLAEAVEPLFDGLRRLIVAAAELAESPGLQQFAQTVSTVLRAVVQEVSGFVAQIANWVRQHLTWDEVREAFLRLAVVVRAGWEILKSVVSTLWDSIVTLVQGIGRALSPAVGAVQNAFGQIAEETGKSGRSFAWWAGFITGAIDTVIRALGGLAQAFANTMTAILHIVVSVGTLIARALVAFLSPFSRHSPSLVEQVEEGVDRIAQAWQSLPSLVLPPLRAVRDAIRSLGGAVQEMTQEFGAAVDSLKAKAVELLFQLIDPGSFASWEETLDLLRSTASDVGAVLEGLVAQARQLWTDFQTGAISAEEARRRLEELKQQMEALSPAVDTVGTAFAELGKAVQAQLDAISRRIEEVQRQLEQLFKTPIRGETAFSQQIESAKLLRDLLNAAVKAKESGTEAIYVQQLQATIAELDEAIAKATEAGVSPEQIARLEQLRTAYQNALTYVNLDVESLKDSLSQMNDTVAALEATGAVTFGRLHEELTALTEVPIPEQPFGELYIAVQQLGEELAELTKQKSELEALQNEIEGIAQSFENATDTVERLISALDQLLPRLEKVGGGGGGGGGPAIALPNPEDILQQVGDEWWLPFESPPAPFSQWDLIMKDFNKGLEDAKRSLTDIESTLGSVAQDLQTIADTIERAASKLDDWQEKFENIKRTMEVIKGLGMLFLAGPLGAQVAVQGGGQNDPLELIFGENWEERMGTKLKERITQRLNEIKTEITSWFTQNSPSFAESGGLLGDSIAEGIGQKREAFKGKMESAAAGVTDWITENAGRIVSWGQDIGRQIGDGLGEKRTTISEKAGELFSGISDWINQSPGTIQGWGGSVAESIGHSIGGKRSFLQQRAGDFLNGINDWILSNGLTLEEWGQSVSTTIGDKVAGMRSWLTNRAGDFLGGIGDWITRNKETMVEWGKRIVEAINEGLSKVSIKWPKIPIPKIEVTWTTIELPHGMKIDIPQFNLTWLAKGGLALSPAVVGVGEAGPEAILPLRGRGLRILSQALEQALANLNLSGSTEVRVYIGERELRDIVRYELVGALR